MRRPAHMMISIIGDWDPYRISAEERGENYVHICDPVHERYIQMPQFDIAYIDSTVGEHGLQWCVDNANKLSRNLFVVIDPDSEAWGDSLEPWDGRSLSNVYFHDSTADESYDHIDRYLEKIVEAWRELQ